MQCCQDGGAGWAEQDDGAWCQSPCEVGNPVDGGWSEWAWTSCSQTCGDGIMTARRYCNSPTPSNGGAQCTGESRQESICFEANCPIDGGWNEWSGWTACPVSCGGGERVRERECNNPPAQFNGVPCRGGARETRRCGRDPCPVDGAWTEWGNWGRCSATCEEGTQFRRRTCTNPAPAHGGRDCEGDSRDTAECNEGRCPIHGGWGEFQPSSECSGTCDSITNPVYREELRLCDNPRPRFGGNDCRGSALRRIRCVDIVKCPIDGGWTEWSEWSACSQTCDVGEKTRERTCTAPAPQYGGEDCEDEPIEVEKCRQPRQCPVHGGWTEWEAWQPCDALRCGLSGRQWRSRTCTNPVPKRGGTYCQGEIIQNRECDRLCAHWSEWSEWGPCNGGCHRAGGFQQRFRKCQGEGSCTGNFQERRDCNICIEDDEVGPGPRYCSEDDNPSGDDSSEYDFSGDDFSGDDFSGDDLSGDGPDDSDGHCWNPICNDQPSCVGESLIQSGDPGTDGGLSYSYTDSIDIDDSSEDYGYSISIDYEQPPGGDRGNPPEDGPPVEPDPDEPEDDSYSVDDGQDADIDVNIPVVDPVEPGVDSSSESYNFDDRQDAVNIPVVNPVEPGVDIGSDSYSFDGGQDAVNIPVVNPVDPGVDIGSDSYSFDVEQGVGAGVNIPIPAAPDDQVDSDSYSIDDPAAAGGNQASPVDEDSSFDDAGGVGIVNAGGLEPQPEESYSY